VLIPVNHIDHWQLTGIAPPLAKPDSGRSTRGKLYLQERLNTFNGN
jgi:hypothetical protein